MDPYYDEYGHPRSQLWDMVHPPGRAPMPQPYEEDPFVQAPPPVADADIEKLRAITSGMDKRRQQAAAMRRALALEKQASAPMKQEGYRQLAQQPRAYGQAGVPEVDRALVGDAVRKQALGEYLTLNPGMKRFLNAPMPVEPKRPTLRENQDRLLAGEYKPLGDNKNVSIVPLPDGGIRLTGLDRPEARAEYANDVRRMSLKAKNDKQAQRERIAAFQLAKRKEQQEQLASPEGRAAAVAASFQGTPAQKQAIFQTMMEASASDARIKGESANSQANRESAASMQRERLTAEKENTSLQMASSKELAELKAKNDRELSALTEARADRRQGQTDGRADRRMIRAAELEAQNAKIREEAETRRAEITARTQGRQQEIQGYGALAGTDDPEVSAQGVAGLQKTLGAAPSAGPAIPPLVPMRSDQEKKALVRQLTDSYANDPTAYDSAEEQEAIRKRMRGMGLTPQDLIARAEENAAPGLWNRLKSAGTLSLGGSPYDFRRRNMSPQETALEQFLTLISQQQLPTDMERLGY